MADAVDISQVVEHYHDQFDFRGALSFFFGQNSLIEKW